MPRNVLQSYMLIRRSVKYGIITMQDTSANETAVMDDDWWAGDGPVMAVWMERI